MFKYYLMGNIFKDKYFITNYYPYIFAREFYSGNPFKTNKPFCCSSGTSSGWVNYYKWDLSELNRMLECQLSFFKERILKISDYGERSIEDKTDYTKIEMREQNMITEHVWDRYEEFETIETDIELKDGDTVKIQDKDYKVLYKFNKDLKRHELYIDFEIKIDIDEELKKKCKDTLIEINNIIKEHNDFIKKVKPVPPPIKVVYEDGGLLNKIKNLFKGKHE